MWYLVVCLFMSVHYGEGSLGDQLAETVQLCCYQGTMYARNHSVGDCSSSVPPDVSPKIRSVCIYAMDQCCREYFTKKEDCEIGIDAAMTLKTCSSLTVDSAKICCRQCSTGLSLGSIRNGHRACEVENNGKNAEELLSSDALVTCCKNASTVQKINEHTDTVTKRNQDNEIVASVCEDYAPNELCAHHCIPIPGSYKCECNPGFMLMTDGKNCKEITNNRCKPRNHCHHKCIDNGFEVKCSCRRGYQLMADGKTCEDINECELEKPVCGPNTQCFNTLRSYKCIPIKKQHKQDKGQCPPGFARNLLNNACDDINECNLPKPPCPSYICENTVGGYTCDGKSGDPENLNNKRPVEDRCPPGFRSSLTEECEDIDECAILSDDCNKLSQFCINTRGSFYCQDKDSKHCPPGFKTNSMTNKCEDINECDDGEDICKPDQICVNVLGEYDCKNKRVSNGVICSEGMRFNPITESCQDIDECAEGTHLCDHYQKCLNTNGSHECHCIAGYALDPTTGACTDINECAIGQNNCNPGTRCDNTVGSYICIRYTSCGTGYILHHTSGTCEDIDECALGFDNCDRAGPEYHCVNVVGSFRCQRQIRTTTPLYDDDYYYEEDDIEEDGKILNKTELLTTSSTTSKPIILPTQAIPKPTPELTTTESPQTTVNIQISDRPSLVNVKEEKTMPEDNLDNSIDQYKKESAAKIPHKIEPQPSNPDYSYKPDTGTEIEEPIEPKKAYETTEYITTPEPKKEIQNIPEYTKVTEATYSPIAESPTSPKLVNVNIDHETAIMKGEKDRDGSVFVDIGNTYKNSWTQIKTTNCQVGFEKDQYGACFDIDECASNQHTCSGLTEICRNTMGGYICDCVFGFRRDIFSGSCTLITASSSTSTTSTTSTTTSTSTTSTTTPEPTTSSTTERYFFGYPEYPTASIRPFRPGSSCDVGYMFNFKTRICEDINECTNGEATCGSAEVCLNTNGGYRCECPPNMRIDYYKQRCVPVLNKGQFPPGYGNEPVYTQVDPNEIIPRNREGEKQIINPKITQVEKNEPDFKCPDGTRLNIYNSCEDINECATGEARCGQFQLCTNLYQGYMCSCMTGYRLVNDHQCEDIDECAITANMSICSQHADCINTMGSYKCRCHNGFRSAPVNDKVCVDVNECAESRSGTLCQQTCNNVWGGYKCSCHRGYRLNPDNRTCSDINECIEFKKRNLCVGNCLNEPGGYRCSCPSGYRLSEDKRSCIDIDECETGTATCAGGDVCFNIRGGYRCHHVTCPQGYQIENGHRCTKIVTHCPPNDWECPHQPSTYSYNFMTFVSNLYIPHESKVDLFTLRGPSWKHAEMRFLLGLVRVDAPPSVKVKADINSFHLIQTAKQGVIALVKPLEGPQSVELDLSMELFNQGQFAGTAVAKLIIYVSEYEF